MNDPRTPIRLIATADLHYNHARGRAAAEELIDKMNQTPADVLLLVGDTAAFDGDALERCLARFRFDGPKLFVAGNHELWTHGDDSYENFHTHLRARIRAIGWHWLEGAPLKIRDVAIVGSVGWYDYSFAEPSLEIPKRFYAAKMSPGAAIVVSPSLLDEDVSDAAKRIVARWNDGKFVKLHRSDEAFLEELLFDLELKLRALQNVSHVVAAIHHLPFAKLLPPSHSAHWDFSKAYLGSRRIGELLLRFENVRTIICGHSHFAAEARIKHIRAINVGSGYRVKRFLTLEI